MLYGRYSKASPAPILLRDDGGASSCCVPRQDSFRWVSNWVQFDGFNWVIADLGSPALVSLPLLSLSLSLSLSYSPLWDPFCRNIIYIYIYIYMYIYIYTYLPIHPSISLYLYIYIYMSPSLSLSLSFTRGSVLGPPAFVATQHLLMLDLHLKSTLC